MRPAVRIPFAPPTSHCEPPVRLPIPAGARCAFNGTTGLTVAIDVGDRHGTRIGRFDEEEAIELNGPGPISGDLTWTPIKKRVGESGSILGIESDLSLA